jgi:hypothetical protein
MYGRGWGARWLARRVPVTFAPAAPATMLTLAASFLLVGLFMRIVVLQIPYLGILSSMWANGILAVAAGMAVWAWAPRLWNPAVAIVAVPIVLIAMAGSMYGGFGRRDILDLVLACAWAGYFSSWRYIGLRRAMYRVAVLGAIGAVVLAAWSATRGAEGKGRTPMQALVEMASADMGKGFTDLISTQQAGPLSMWLCEQRPGAFPYDTLHQGRMFLFQPVPRQIMPSKPGALGRIMVDQRNLEGFSEGFTVGPGLVGHIVNDNPWLALIPYAVFLALVFRFMDELIGLHVYNPFVVLPLGVAMGQFFGIPRGEAALFLFMGLNACLGAWVAMAICAKALQMIGLRIEENTRMPGSTEDEYLEQAEEVPEELDGFTAGQLPQQAG